MLKLRKKSQGKNERLFRRKNRISKILKNHTDRPVLYVNRSLRYIYAQVIDTTTGKTLVSASDMKLDSKSNKTERAAIVGKEVAEKATKAGIKEIAFHRWGYKYHGRVKALAEAARENGLVF